MGKTTDIRQLKNKANWSKVPPDFQKFLKLRFEKNLTCKQVGEKYKISIDRVKRIEVKILEKIKN